MWSIGGCGNSGSLIGSQLPVKKVWPSYSFHFASQAFSDGSTISGQDQFDHTGILITPNCVRFRPEADGRQNHGRLIKGRVFPPVSKNRSYVDRGDPTSAGSLILPIVDLVQSKQTTYN